MTLTSEQQRGYFKMIGNTTQLTYITDPQFADVSGPCSAALRNFEKCRMLRIEC